jgi:hypothetical protein
MVKKLLRLVGTGLAVVIAIRILDSVLTPALPLLVSLFVLALIFYIALHGFRRDL